MASSNAHAAQDTQGSHAGCDVWALGCLLYELVTGSVLFPSDLDWPKFFITVTDASQVWSIHREGVSPGTSTLFALACITQVHLGFIHTMELRCSRQAPHVMLHIFCRDYGHGRLLVQALLSPLVLQTLEHVTPVADLLVFILVRDLAQRPSAKAVFSRLVVHP